MLTGVRRLLGTSAVFLAIIQAGVAEAAWPSDPNINVPLCIAANGQFNPTITSDGVGGVIVTWFDTRSGTADIYAQRVNAAGAPQWTANGVALCTAASYQYNPQIVSDGSGGAIVTWYDYRDGSGTADIYAQRVNAAGTPQWTADGVALCTATYDQYNPTIVSDGSGGAIVTWQDIRSGTSFDTYAQRVNAAGAPQWTAGGVALCTAANHQYTPAVVSDGAGGAIVAWQDGRSGTSYDIYAQRLNAAGVPQWTADGVALCTAPGDQQVPTITTDGVGGAIVTWSDFHIFASRVDAAGVPQWTANGVALCTAGGGQGNPTIVSDGVGGAIVTWHDYRGGFSNTDIYAQRVNSAGAPQWADGGVALCSAANKQLSPAIISDGASGAIVTWYDLRGGSTNDIYAQRVTAAGVPQWGAGGTAICTAVRDQLNPAIASNGAGGAIVTWYDLRSVH
jgi:hypothetical protein